MNMTMKRIYSFCLLCSVIVFSTVSCLRTGDDAEGDAAVADSAVVPSADADDETVIPEFDRGSYYSLKYKGSDYYFRIDSQEGDKSRGVYYSVDEGPVAQPHIFMAGKRARRYVVSTDDREFKLNPKRTEWIPYVEPAYTPMDTSMFRKPFCKVSIYEDIVYGNAPGYWCSLPGVEEDVSRIFSGGLVNSFGREDIDLTMDVYVPEGIDAPKPLIMFIHGGAFYIGDKQEPAYVDFCTKFAQMGYVTASINYRLGFHIGKGEIERAQYAALQDAHAAMRYLVSKADEIGIDPDRLYVAGSSAGSITALGLAFMREKDRPKASFGGKGLFNRNNMGRIDGSGNEIRTRFSIRAVANMWGAVPSTDILSNGKSAIISFHGTEDTVVPYYKGLPFADAPEAVAGLLAETMYGSVCIDSVARAIGLRSEFYPFPGEGHAFNTMGKSKMPNANHKLVRNHIRDFFFEDMVPQRVHMTDRGEGRYSVDRKEGVSGWKAEGGFILSSSPTEAEVLWRADAPERRISADGEYFDGVAFCVEKTL